MTNKLPTKEELVTGWRTDALWNGVALLVALAVMGFNLVRYREDGGTFIDVWVLGVVALWFGWGFVAALRKWMKFRRYSA